MNFIAKILLNSLYGRFGMDDNFTEVNIIHKDYFPDFENKYLDNISKVTEIGDYYLVELKIDNNNNNNENETHNISIATASAITSYARIHMSQFKNNHKINLYYTDTDSIYTDSDIDESFIDEKTLGKLKLENTCKKAIFLSPKVYCLQLESGELIYKVKGLKHEIELTMTDFEHLLNKEAYISKHQTKFFRNLSDANIEIRNELYTLQITDNKRELIYNKNNKLIGTDHYKISNTKNIQNK
jgi:DNA polymerase type B, organellar and viral